MSNLNGVVLKTKGVWKCAITSGGSSYESEPDVSFSGGGGIDAAGYSVISDGAVTDIIITNPGKGYTSEPDVNFSGGGGISATATSTLNTGYLLRYGYCDFESDGSFDIENEEQHGDVPSNRNCFNDPFDISSLTLTIWDGSEWTTILRK